jgi:predicted DNA binding CopG/RHH family protein
VLNSNEENKQPFKRSFKMKKNYFIQVPVSKTEKIKIKQKAQKMGMTTASFIRYVCLRGKIKTSLEIV